ncbi:beta-xylosidase [Bradyrhizobium sp. ORS 111]|uniref:beta-xylosidase n=1 Tax=Bradyrhizobium sp. ORS 111 TaxID=1685958 RepID=UPI00388D02B1
MIEAAKIWNEPNNKSHWDIQLDPGWIKFGELAVAAGKAIRDVHATLPRILGGMSPIDPSFMRTMRSRGVLDHVDAIGVHGFPLDWNLWQIDEWPSKLAGIEAEVGLPIWVTEVGVSSFGAEEVQAWGLERTAELLIGRAPRIHWYSLYDLPSTWEATTRHKEAEGSSYYRHFHMGLLRADGSPKQAVSSYERHAASIGLCQWFHFEDHRLNDAANWMRRLGVRHLRTGISWADSFRPNALDWFDRQMDALADFDVTLTFCFTPEHRGVIPHHTSPPLDPNEFADFCAGAVERYCAKTGVVHRPSRQSSGSHAAIDIA